MIADADISEPGSPALSPKRILFQHTFQLPKRGGKEQKPAPRANNSTDRKRRSDGKPKEEKLTREPSQPDRLDRTPVHDQQTSQPLPESGTETTTLTSRQEYERLRRQRPERRETARKTARERRQRAKELGLCRTTATRPYQVRPGARSAPKSNGRPGGETKNPAGKESPRELTDLSMAPRSRTPTTSSR